MRRPHLPAWMRVYKKIIQYSLRSHEKGQKMRRRSVMDCRWQQGSRRPGADPKHSAWPLGSSLLSEKFSRNQGVPPKWEEPREEMRERSWDSQIEEKLSRGKVKTHLRAHIPKQRQLFNGKVLSRMIGWNHITASRATRWPEQWQRWIMCRNRVCWFPWAAVRRYRKLDGLER